MAQARTLDEAQIKRVQRYLRTRRNSTRDSTIFTFAFNTGLRAKELAALCVGDAYDAEGAVRDAFLGRHNPNPDLDLVVRSDALRHYARLAKTFGGKHVVLDEQRDIARLVINGWTIDLARQEGDGLEDDLWRRDYSLNALALPLQPLAPLCDPTGGLDDLKHGCLRAVREQNLLDDPLRLLRGLRFLAEIPLVLDAQTGEWIQRHRQALVVSAPERILAELQRLVKGPTDYRD